MSDAMRFDFAIQEPALAIAPVFLALKKGNRKKLDVTRTFGDSTLQWRGPDALGMPEQSALLGLLSIAGQQTFMLDPKNHKEAGRQLLARLTFGGVDIHSDLAVLKASWTKIVTASGYKSSGGNNIKIVKMSLKRLAETTVWENRHGIEYQSKLLAWIAGDSDGVTIVLNRRATDALSGGQHVKISLQERNALADEPAKALHAWLSGHMRQGSTRLYKISNFQTHVWGEEATGSTLRSRLSKLRRALGGIDLLADWNCHLMAGGQVEIKRINRWTIDDKPTDFDPAEGTIDNGKKSAGLKEASSCK